MGSTLNTRCQGSRGNRRVLHVAVVIYAYWAGLQQH